MEILVQFVYLITVLCLILPQLGFGLHLSGNLALNAPTSMSSTYGGLASNALDGKRGSSCPLCFCTHTQQENDPWWRVELAQRYFISKVTITNRGDCCEQRLNGAQIHIGNNLDNNGNNNTLVAEIKSLGRGVTATYSFSPVEGRFVNIFLPGPNRILTLCEVEVFTNGTENVASGGLAVQSSIYDPTSHSSVAVDGNGHHRHGCAHTKYENNPWWQVDLQDSYDITQVAITNRGDCCHDRIIGMEIRVGDSLENHGNNNTRVAVVDYIPPGETKRFSFNPTRGRYVNLIIPGTYKVITICEVEVYAIVERNVATLGRASQSSLVLGELASFGHALNAIDGNADTDVVKGSCAMTGLESDPWWRVDLHERYRVSAVKLTSPKKSSPKELSGAHIRIGDATHPKDNALCAKVKFVRPGESLVLECVTAMEGRFVSVSVSGPDRSLSLCEVEVLATPVAVYSENTHTYAKIRNQRDDL